MVLSLLLIPLLLVGQNPAFKDLIYSFDHAKAIKYRSNSTQDTSYSLSSLSNFRPHNVSLSNASATTLSSEASSKEDHDCINYAPSTRTITVSCNSIRLTDLYNQLHDSSILAKQSLAGSGVWLLNANLVIAKGATFLIDSTDTKWLRLSSKVLGPAFTPTTANAKFSPPPAYSIVIHGSLKIDSVKITGWDPIKNTYPLSHGSRTGRGNYIFGTPRPYIYVDYNASGTTNITNSEIAYLGYETGKHKGASGLSYYAGDGSILRNNNIHDIYFGFYSIGVAHMIIENNIVRNSGHYGLDPHTGTHDMIIRNNTVYNNNGSGIICSLNCYNILIENNKVHDNAGDGIDFSRFTYNSIARNNIVYKEPKGIFITRSHNNQVYDNTILNSVEGIKVGSASDNNQVYDNTITNSKAHAILVDNGSSSNTFYSNKIMSATPPGLKMEQDPTSKNNVFSNNQLIHTSVEAMTTAFTTRK